MPMTSLTPTRLIGSFMVEKAQKTCSLDEVDTILEAWQALIPGTDLTPMAVFSRVSRLSRHLDVARREAFSSQDLEPWAFDVLAALRRSGAPFAMTPGALMLQSLVSSGTMTNRIDRLEERGLVHTGAAHQTGNLACRCRYRETGGPGNSVARHDETFRGAAPG